MEQESERPEEAASALSLHYFEASEYQPAWRYGRIAAERAESAYAHVEAANLYLRAIAAGRHLDTLTKDELATVQQSVADAWYRGGEFKKASEAYAATRALVPDDRQRDAGLMLKLSFVEEKLGNYAEAMRWAQSTRDVLKTIEGAEAAHAFAEAGAWCAALLQFEGRTGEALEWAERTVGEAEAADDPDSLAEAYFVIAWAYGELGREGAEEMMQRSLECFQRSKNLRRQAGVVLSLGVICQWEGRWDEALAYYERGRDANTKVGNTVATALTKINVAELLTDRGEWAEAEVLLLETLPFWKAAQYHYYLAACLSILGRVSLRLGRRDEALKRLGESKAQFLEVGAEQEVPAVDARIAECRIEMCEADAALEIVNGLLANAESSTGVARMLPLLQRIQGHALMQQNDLWGARDALEASLASARERKNVFETTLTMLSLVELDKLEGVEPPLDIVEESRAMLAKLKVRAVPPVPKPAQ
jgi:tetratricopeptide (TPR) repeat protein